jgi:hypothetical protein
MMASGRGWHPLPRKLVAVPCECSPGQAAGITRALLSRKRTSSTRTGAANGCVIETRPCPPKSLPGLRSSVASDAPEDHPVPSLRAESHHLWSCQTEN